MLRLLLLGFASYGVYTFANRFMAGIPHVDDHRSGGMLPEAEIVDGGRVAEPRTATNGRQPIRP